MFLWTTVTDYALRLTRHRLAFRHRQPSQLSPSGKPLCKIKKKERLEERGPTGSRPSRRRERILSRIYPSRGRLYGQIRNLETLKAGTRAVLANDIMHSRRDSQDISWRSTMRDCVCIAVNSRGVAFTCSRSTSKCGILVKITTRR